jgi:DNA-binding helix-hairpin-helix protein with protein kinase domain
MTERIVTTIEGARYRLTEELGRGGQGAVFRTDNGRYAVKLLRNRSPAARGALADRLAMVSRLPIEDLDVARPLARLREPDLGYVMELYTGMVPIRALLVPPPETPSLARWYFDGGGLRRRLQLLARTADLLARLHGRGLVYTDPSPNNVFVSATVEDREVRLIDTDNLRADSVVGQAVFTPKYGAPELIAGRAPASSLTDAHAFAVLVFETLTLAHPLFGDLVEVGEPELEEAALAGELPWIEHPEDDRNRSSRGIPRPRVLSRNLSAQLAATFGPGLADPAKRPGLAGFAEHLHRAADNTLRCPACGATYYRAETHCPWCQARRPTFVSLDCVLWDPERLMPGTTPGAQAVDPGEVRKPADGPMRVVDSAAVGRGESLDLADRLALGTGDGKPQLRVRHEPTRLIIEALAPGAFKLVSFDGRGERRLDQGPAAIPLGDGTIQWYLRTGESARLHRIIRFTHKEGA